MNKLFKMCSVSVLSVLMMLVLVVPMSAEEKSSIEDQSLFLYSEDSIAELNNDVVEPSYGDTKVTKNSVLFGLQLENQLNNKGISFRSEGEEYRVRSVKTIRGFGFLKSQFLQEVPAGVTVTQSKDASISIGTTVHGIKLSAGVTFKESYSYTGPSSNYIGAGGVPTHRLYSAILYGTISEYTFDVYTKYSGVYLRSEVETLVSDNRLSVFSNEASIQSHGEVLYSSANENIPAYIPSIKYFIDKVNGEKGWEYILFDRPFRNTPDNPLIFP